MRFSATCPPHADFVEDPTQHDYAAAARWALGQKDLPLAIEQVSAAIALAPLEAEHHRLLDAILAEARGPLRLLALPPEGAFYGLCAVRGRVLARLGRYAEALEHVLAASAFSPSSPFVVWVRPWLTRGKGARRVSQAALAANVIALLSAIDARATLDEGMRLNLEAALDCCLFVAARARRKKGVPRDDTLAVVCARLFRRLGRPEEALELLGDHERKLGPSWELACARAAVLADLGDQAGRIAVLEGACELRAEEPSTFLDLGDAYLALGDPEGAAAAYRAGLERDDTSAWARIHHAYATLLAQPQDAQRLPPPAADAPAQLAQRAALLATDLAVYREVLGQPIDPVIGVLRSVARQLTHPAPKAGWRIRVQADRPLAPSAKLAFHHLLAAQGLRGDLAVEDGGAAPKLGPLWRADAASPAWPPPAPAVLARIAEIAETPFGWRAWRERARALGGAPAHDCIASMAHVPPPPAGGDAVQWVHRWQVAAALLAAAAPEPPAERRQQLTALAAGRDDWSAAAGLLGLDALAEEQPELAPALGEQLAGLLPAPGEALPPCSWALAVVGMRLARGELRRSFGSLRARVLAELLQRGSVSEAEPAAAFSDEQSLAT